MLIHDMVLSVAASPADSTFVADARCNLLIVRTVYGPHSRRYRRLVRRYRTVADSLGCRRAIERLLHPLPRRYVRPARPSWPTDVVPWC